MSKKEKEMNEEIKEEEVVETKEDSLIDKVKELEEQLAVAKNQYFKVFADAENTKKRLQQDFDMLNKYRLQSFALEILPALDNLERALPTIEEDNPIRKGVEMIYQQILSSLKKEGVEEIEALDQPFDPNYHHAIMAEKVDGKEANIVVEVLQKGYKIKDRILRATLVKVSE